MGRNNIKGRNGTQDSWTKWRQEPGAHLSAPDWVSLPCSTTCVSCVFLIRLTVGVPQSHLQSLWCSSASGEGQHCSPLSHDAFGLFPPLVTGLPAAFTAVCFCLPSYSLSYPRVGPPLNGHYSHSLSSLASTRWSTDQRITLKIEWLLYLVFCYLKLAEGTRNMNICLDILCDITLYQRANFENLLS